MKTKLALIFLFVWIGSQTNAQVKPFRFGVKVAPNISWLSPDSDGYVNDGSALGFAWGFMADITLTENYFIKTGFNLEYLNGNLQYPHQLILDDDQSSAYTTGIMERKYSLQYLELPLTLKMRTNQFDKIAYFGEIGFGTAFNIKAQAQDNFTYNSESGESTLQTESNIIDEIAFMRFSMIVGAGAEYFIDESTSVILSLNYSNGLSNILKGDNSIDNSIKQRAQLNGFYLNIGILF